jgi:hypothetical protein
MLPKRQSSPLPSLITFVDRLSADLFANRIGAELKMRWFVHVLARLAIAATSTSSAAALDAQVAAPNTLSPLTVVGASHVEFTWIAERCRQTVQRSEPRATHRLAR